jgi:hypothetical protein
MTKPNLTNALGVEPWNPLGHQHEGGQKKKEVPSDRDLKFEEDEMKRRQDNELKLQRRGV